MASGIVVGTVTTGPAGDLKFQFDAASADPGLYVVTASVNPSATVTFVVDAEAPVRDPVPGATGTVFDVPAGIALDEAVYLPLVMGAQ